MLGTLTAVMAAVSLAATALIVPGTGTPDANLVDKYRENFRDYYMQDTACTNDMNCAPNNTGDPANEGMLGINYPASFWPIPLPGWCPNLSCDTFDVSVGKGVDNLDEALQALQDLGYDGDIVIAGYSQGARVATIAKMQFASGQWDDLLDQVDSVEFVFIGNPNRPNGGILSRFGALGHIPILDVTTGQPTPTNVGIPTEDWAIRWEGIADFPQYLLNPLAVANSLLGFYYDHGTYLATNEDSDPGELPAGYDVDTWREITSHPEQYPGIVDIQKFGDTTYYTVTPKVLPLVRPLHSIPLIGKPIADLIEPALRVIIEETGYNRNISFGQPTEIGLLPIFNPITLFFKLVPAVFVGINNFLANFGLTKEIPLSPTTPVPAINGEEEDDTDLTLLAGDKLDGSSTAKLALMQRKGETTGVDNAKTLIANIQPEGGLTLTEGNESLVVEGNETPAIEGNESPVVEGNETPAIEGNETPVIEGNETPVIEGNGTPSLEGAVGSEEPQQTVLGQTRNGNGEALGEKNLGILGKDPEVKKDPGKNSNSAQNRVDANGRGASLSFSPNTPGVGAKTGGEEAKQTDPSVTPESPKPPDGAENSDDSQDSQPAAA
ncbi:PE-PPE domain-containing protein [Mycobacterium sp. E136]|uniref:PE-PPE domain-containing protein n=1 Tax=Mycobacterium sp. E136 TaxID=1834125 RepID=UPI001E5B28F5|nr:PE-PPE domain-containing protein [Mycobacterium sp. E136]